ncbi:MAG: peptide chain release factor N(5)-glutamine methyltransferase [Bacteroidia bacterium]|nr:peptide chain release factor N(5)-glutamine methyltransferase [Bacteroidia bacterium]
MTNSKKLFNELVKSIRLDDSLDEIQSIVYLLLEEKLGLRRMDIMVGREIEPVAQDYFVEIVERINKQEPIQYILGKGEFYGRQFIVNNSVLIPRPETELLVGSVIESNVSSPTILDIGTGSGCIATTLALEIPTSKVYAIDVSAEAILIAERNAINLMAEVHFSKLDILNDTLEGQFDIIVSNPPYVSMSERKAMKSNVVDYEPHLALFVSDENPLVFYKMIAKKGRLLLRREGKMYVEINEKYGREVTSIFKKAGYDNLIIKKDVNGKDRVVIAKNSQHQLVSISLHF